ncbi:MAG: isoprenylcysteine carboxylmethyltransferase family protein [Gemmatimonadota bacterium]
MNSARGSVLALVVLVACILGLYSQSALLATGSPLVVVQLLAVALMVWARITFGMRSFHGAANPTDGGLVTTGPYALVRHPIYASILLFIWPGIAAQPSLLSVALGVLAIAAIGVRIAAEELLVIARYPDYAAYAAKTKRLIPGLY